MLRGVTDAADLAVVSGGLLAACSGSLGTKKKDDGASFSGGSGNVVGSTVTFGSNYSDPAGQVRLAHADFSGFSGFSVDQGEDQHQHGLIAMSAQRPAPGHPGRSIPGLLDIILHRRAPAC
ncbi:hypothetical protein OH809_09010 [Streptomyces sp. NBC_00873]|uniref:hypothetical protein n=1 Tax=Streptomyces sp. NBC_00873 TaxID=2975852 RepID=UPI00386B97EC|nr:hypothetical protein OH809_09010 [Streptomyces sp. NBC_00873]